MNILSLVAGPVMNAIWGPVKALGSIIWKIITPEKGVMNTVHKSLKIKNRLDAAREKLTKVKKDPYDIRSEALRKTAMADSRREVANAYQNAALTNKSDRIRALRDQVVNLSSNNLSGELNNLINKNVNNNQPLVSNARVAELPVTDLTTKVTVANTGAIVSSYSKAAKQLGESAALGSLMTNQNQQILSSTNYGIQQLGDMITESHKIQSTGISNSLKGENLILENSKAQSNLITKLNNDLNEAETNIEKVNINSDKIVIKSTEDFVTNSSKLMKDSLFVVGDELESKITALNASSASGGQAIVKSVNESEERIHQKIADASMILESKQNAILEATASKKKEKNLLKIIKQAGQDFIKDYLVQFMEVFALIKLAIENIPIFQKLNAFLLGQDTHRGTGVYTSAEDLSLARSKIQGLKDKGASTEEILKASKEYRDMVGSTGQSYADEVMTLGDVDKKWGSTKLNNRLNELRETRFWQSRKDLMEELISKMEVNPSNLNLLQDLIEESGRQWDIRQRDKGKAGFNARGGKKYDNRFMRRTEKMTNTWPFPDSWIKDKNGENNVRRNLLIIASSIDGTFSSIPADQYFFLEYNQGDNEFDTEVVEKISRNLQIRMSGEITPEDIIEVAKNARTGQALNYLKNFLRPRSDETRRKAIDYITKEKMNEIVSKEITSGKLREKDLNVTARNDEGQMLEYSVDTKTEDHIVSNLDADDYTGVDGKVRSKEEVAASKAKAESMNSNLQSVSDAYFKELEKLEKNPNMPKHNYANRLAIYLAEKYGIKDPDYLGFKVDQEDPSQFTVELPSDYHSLGVSDEKIDELLADISNDKFITGISSNRSINPEIAKDKTNYSPNEIEYLKKRYNVNTDKKLAKFNKKLAAGDYNDALSEDIKSAHESYQNYFNQIHYSGSGDGLFTLEADVANELNALDMQFDQQFAKEKDIAKKIDMLNEQMNKIDQLISEKVTGGPELVEQLKGAIEYIDPSLYTSGTTYAPNFISNTTYNYGSDPSESKN